VSGFTGQVSQSSDDAVENGSGTVTINGSTLSGNTSAGAYWGFRWQNVTIPNAAAISACTVSVWATTGTTIDRTIDFQNSASAATFSTSSTNISGRTLTGNSVTWNHTPTSGAFNATSSLVTPFQALVNLAGWSSGDAAVAVFAAVLAGSAVEAYDGSSSEAAEISITYTSGGGGGPTNNAALIASPF
jgi:hypothetical protein